MKHRDKSKAGWAGRAAQVVELLPRSRLHPAVLKWTAGRRSGETWCVAFSGGADSLALLLSLRAHWPERTCVALHFNHHLRGREADIDARFCQRVGRALGLKVKVGHWRGAPLKASAAESRQARHAFFAREMKRLGSRVLWLAHQQDDVAESMLMRLARGSGGAGLAAPRPVQSFAGARVHLRPLLTLPKKELVRILRQVGAEWREDESNGRPDHFRNRIRKSVLPAWRRAAGRDVLAGAALARELLEEDDNALEDWVDRVGAHRQGRLDVGSLRGLPRAVIRRCLHRWLQAVKPRTDLSRQGFELLLAAVEQAKATRFSLGRTDFAVIQGGILTLRRR